MRIKLDENLDPRAKEILINGGHEVASVEDQGLKGRADADIARVVREETQMSDHPRSGLFQRIGISSRAVLGDHRAETPRSDFPETTNPDSPD